MSCTGGKMETMVCCSQNLPEVLSGRSGIL